jgi:hypothetical protein
LGSFLEKGFWNLPASAIDDYPGNLYDMKKRIPVLERERFIADTLYKKLWIHDFKPCPYWTWLFCWNPLVENRAGAVNSPIEKSRDIF